MSVAVEMFEACSDSIKGEQAVDEAHEAWIVERDAFIEAERNGRLPDTVEFEHPETGAWLNLSVRSFLRQCDQYTKIDTAGREYVVFMHPGGEVV